MSPIESTRLLPLHDGRPGLRGHLRITATVPNTAATRATLDFVCSDETLDRYNEIISATGWRLENYHRNPVFQNSHQYGDILFTLGKAITTEVRQIAGRQALFQRIQFAVEANPIAKIAHTFYAHGYLRRSALNFSRSGLA